MMTPGRALQLAQDAFSGSTSYFDANIRPRAERDLRAFQSLHPTGSKYLSETYRSKSKIFRPKTRATIRRNEAIASEAFFSTSTWWMYPPKTRRSRSNRHPRRS